MIAIRCAPRWLSAAAILLCPLVAHAQAGRRALVSPGEPVSPQLLTTEGGPAGRDLAQLIGKRPVLGMYWRPGEPPSENALVNSVSIAGQVAPEVEFFPLAALAASQSPTAVQERLSALNLTLPPREDNGQLAMVLGVRSIPSFFLIDAGGVLRLVGGVDITQAGKDGGLSIVEAVALAGKGAPVPTIGVLAGDPIFRLMGKKLPDANVTEMDGATYRRLGQYAGKGKRLLIFYWSPTCPHCKAAWPGLAAWYRNRKPDDLQLIAIARGDSPSLRMDAEKFVKDLPGIHLADVDRSASILLMVRETPTSFLVDKKGDIAGIRPGGEVDWEKWVKGNESAGSGQR